MVIVAANTFYDGEFSTRTTADGSIKRISESIIDPAFVKILEIVTEGSVTLKYEKITKNELYLWVFGLVEDLVHKVPHVTKRKKHGISYGVRKPPLY